MAGQPDTLAGAWRGRCLQLRRGLRLAEPPVEMRSVQLRVLGSEWRAAAWLAGPAIPAVESQVASLERLVMSKVGSLAAALRVRLDMPKADPLAAVLQGWPWPLKPA